MKKIEAIIRKSRFEDVKKALLAADIEWFSYYNCSDSDTALVNGHGGTGITKNKIKNEYQYE